MHRLWLFGMGMLLLASCRRSAIADCTDHYFDLSKDSIRLMLDCTDDIKSLSKKEQASYALLALQIEEDRERMDSLRQVAYLYYSTHPDSVRLGYCYYWSGLIAEMKHNSLLAAAHYLRCCEVYPRKDDFLAHVHLFLGFVFDGLGESHESIHWFMQAVRHHEQQHNWDKAAFALMWTSPLFLKLDIGLPDSALYYARKELDYMQRCRSVFLDSPYMTISQAYLMKGDVEQATLYNELSKKAYGNTNPLRQNANQVSILYHRGEYASALEYARRIPESYYDIHSNDLWTARIHEKMGHYKEALVYERKYREEEQTRRRTELRKNLENLRFLIERNETTEQNLLYKAAARTRLYRQTAVATLALVLFGSLFGYHRYRVSRTEQRLKEKELKQLALEHRFEKQKRQEVELRERFFRRLNRLSLQIGGGQQRPFTETEWQSLVDNADAAFGGLTDRLKQRYPTLNDEDIRYCCLIKMGLSQAEIAEIVCREKASVKKRIRRIALEKMGAQEGQQLKELLDEKA